jgi:tRNA threonylcarbamoyladenosine biosynthesis protein TsaE
MISHSSKETEKISKVFLTKLKPAKTRATVVGLYGELGTGKTTFIQFIAKELKVKRRVNSPTFVILKSYKLKGKNYKKLFHLDAYRLKNEKELLHLGWNEIVSNKEHLVFIEWPENVIKALPKKHHQIHISHLPCRNGAEAGTKKENRKFEIKRV